MSTTLSTPPTDGAASAANRALARRFVDEVINAHDLDAALTELVAEDFVEQNPLPGQGPGRAGLGDVLGGLFAAFPDLHWAPQEMLADGDRVMTFSVWTGTQRGPFMGIPATGRSVTVEAWTIDRFDAGQMAESRILMDVAGLLIQLGAIPAPAAG
jgi:steroid delta-isomerase-like uncharacterized protein